MPEQESAQNKLPNIEEATRSYVRSKLAAWDEEILRLRAERLGVSKEEAAAVAPARCIFHASDGSFEILQQSTYPTPECLLPEEVEDYLQGDSLGGKRLAHAQTCEACTALLAASFPDDLGDILPFPSWDERVVSNQLATSPAKAAFKLPATPDFSSGHPVLTFRSWAKDLATHVLPPAFVRFLAPSIIGLTVAVLVLLRIDKPATSLTVPASHPGKLVFLLCGFACLVTFRALPLYPLRRDWTLGVILAVGAVGYVLIDFQQSRTSIPMAFAWARYKTESMALTAIEHRHSSGNFLNQGQAAKVLTTQAESRADLKISVRDMSAQVATYVVTADGIPGQLVAVVGPDSGDVKWEDGDKVLKHIELRSGTVDASHPGDPLGTLATVQLDDGRTVQLASSGDAPLAKPGSRVLAAVDPGSTVVDNYRVVSYGKVPKQFHNAELH